jgi:hypothetical protein
MHSVGAVRATPLQLPTCGGVLRGRCTQRPYEAVHVRRFSLHSLDQGVGWVELRETQRFCGRLDVGIRFARPNLQYVRI